MRIGTREWHQALGHVLDKDSFALGSIVITLTLLSLLIVRVTYVLLAVIDKAQSNTVSVVLEAILCP